MYFVEILYICKNKLGYSEQDARHVYIGEYKEQFEIYKKFYNMQINKRIFIEDKEEETKTRSDNDNPEWYNKYMREKGVKNGK